MSRSVEHAKIETPTSRAKLKRGKRHYQLILTGKAHLGYRREEGAPHGRWFLRRNLGDEKYQYLRLLGVADDQKGIKADGVMVLDFEQAKATAIKTLEDKRATKRPKGSHTVQNALEKYIKHLENEGKRFKEVRQRAEALIYPDLGKIKLVDLTSDHIEDWKAGLVTKPARLRTKKGAKEHNTKPDPIEGEAERKRKNSANRVLGMLRAALNYIYREYQRKAKEQWADTDDAWAFVKRYKKADAARPGYLQIDEAKRLINACDPEFRLLVQAALQTGCRYGELCRLRVRDFKRDIGKVEIRISKSGHPRHVILTAEGVAFFTQITAGRPPKEIMLRHNQGRAERVLERHRHRLEREGKAAGQARVDEGEWRQAEQTVPMREACQRAGIDPPINFHALRHSWASLSLMGGTPMMVVAENLGHKDTQMVQKHYGHLSDGYKEKAIRDGAPKFGFVADTNVAMLKAS
jgi:integrase